MQNLFQPRLPYRSHFLLFIQSALETFGGERNSFSLPYLELASGDMPPFTPLPRYLPLTTPPGRASLLW